MEAIGLGAGFALASPPGPGAAFDFSGGTMPPGATLTRASVATRRSGSGSIVTAGVDVPRFDHDPVSRAVRGLLLEGAATNLLTWSDDPGQAGWARVSVTTPEPGAIVESDASAGNTAHYVAQAPAYVAGVPYTLSVVASERAGSAKRYLMLYFHASSHGGTYIAKFDLDAGAVVFATAGLTATIAPAGVGTGAGRWLCAISRAASLSAVGSTMIRLSNSADSALSHVGDGVSGLMVEGAQIEVGEAPSSRIATAAATATRAADALRLDWAGRGVGNGATVLRCLFDNGATQDVAATIAGGAVTLPVPLARGWLRRVTLG